MKSLLITETLNTICLGAYHVKLHLACAFIKGTYKWSDGSAMDYTNWSDDNTNNDSSDCVSETSSGWIVQECTGGYALTYVCKYSLSSGQRGDIGSKYRTSLGLVEPMTL